MTRQRLEFLFDRYTAGTISQSEKTEFLRAIAESDYDAELRELLDELWLSTPAQSQFSEAAQLFRKLPLSDKKVRVMRWLPIAASVTALVLCGVAFYFINQSQPIPPHEVASVNHVPNNSFIRLPDGSTVVLNTGSHLEYPSSFDGAETRTVILKGEGFFDITHDATRPFIVVSGNVTTTVLGTAFNIKAFPEQNEVVVTVSRGKVEVSSDKKVVGILTRDQQLTITNGSSRTKDHVDSRDVSNWRESSIAFEDITLKDALAELASRFDTSIQLIDNTASHCRFTGSFIRGETLEQMLLVICEFNNVTAHYDSEDGVYEVSGAGCDD